MHDHSPPSSGSTRLQRSREEPLLPRGAPRRSLWGALLCARLVLATCPPHAALADKTSDDPMYFGLGVQLFFDDGDLDAEQQVSVQAPTDESYEHGSDGFLSMNAWALFPMGSNIYVGGQVQYLFDYETAGATNDNENICSPNDNNNVCSLGHLIEVSGRAEYLIEVLGDLDVAVGGQLGVAMLIPGGDLQGEIEALQNQQVDVLGAGVPRIGYLVGPIVGTRWRFHELISFRGELAMKWEQLFIFNTEQTVSGIAFRKSWTDNILRYEINAGLEVAF